MCRRFAQTYLAFECVGCLKLSPPLLLHGVLLLADCLCALCVAQMYLAFECIGCLNSRPEADCAALLYANTQVREEQLRCVLRTHAHGGMYPSMRTWRRFSRNMYDSVRSNFWACGIVMGGMPSASLRARLPFIFVQ